MHALLTHLAGKGLLGFDEAGREVLTLLEGETVGSAEPWPAWTHALGGARGRPRLLSSHDEVFVVRTATTRPTELGRALHSLVHP
ncbi:hypothetical protein GCM10010365_23800 [Streptomyces poonensis]|uniref:Uncharacterized protein n=1 Tax=Streptomyces poonensis TaxID=68255 RepID=A0A918PG63_9ACTN|nr:hypothetical protein GCM10010365_23800 [Streptomyces poonensis]GLJ90819.1 hypothetical protein GCM10017589_34240 [Streptomyces poonensis]